MSDDESRLVWMSVVLSPVLALSMWLLAFDVNVGLGGLLLGIVIGAAGGELTARSL